jgi:hypothetical protein
MKEIGGYFGLEQLVSNEYYSDLISFNNGRNALLYLLKAKNIKKLYIPYYLCNSVSDMYEYLYIVNYYGQLTDEKVIDLKRQYLQIILDNIQAFFQKPVAGIDTIYSCRKFFGVPDGGYLSTHTRRNEELEIDVSRDRMTHILGRYEGAALDYYSYFQNNDASFKIEPLKYMSKLTHNILGAIDYERVRKIRNENYAYLDSELGGQNKLNLIASDGAFAYPFYVENGIDIRKALAQKKIYIPTLWPNVLADTPEDWIEHDYAVNILPLPCDQRYGIEDMKYLVVSLKKYF